MSAAGQPPTEPTVERGPGCLPFCNAGLHESTCPNLKRDTCVDAWHDGSDPGPCPGCGYLRPQDRTAERAGDEDDVATRRARIETAAMLGWSTFGTHVDQPDVALEFAGDDGGVPEFERPVLPAADHQRIDRLRERLQKSDWIVCAEALAILATQPAAVPDRAEDHDEAEHGAFYKRGYLAGQRDLRAAVEALADDLARTATKYQHPTPYLEGAMAADADTEARLRAVLGAPGGALAKVKAQTLRDAAIKIDADYRAVLAHDGHSRAARIVRAEADRIEGTP